MILDFIERYDCEMSLEDMIMNFIKKYDYEFYWKIWFWTLSKDMIVNFIGKHDFKFYRKIWFWNFIERYDFEFYKNIFKILRRLISRCSFVNKSLTISMFSFLTAKHSGVL